MSPLPTSSATWRRLLSAALALLLVMQFAGWATHALTHLETQRGSQAETLAEPAVAYGHGRGAPAGEPGCGLCAAFHHGVFALLPGAPDLPASPQGHPPYRPAFEQAAGHGRTPVHRPARAPPV